MVGPVKTRFQEPLEELTHLPHTAFNITSASPALRTPQLKQFSKSFFRFFDLPSGNTPLSGELTSSCEDGKLPGDPSNFLITRRHSPKEPLLKVIYLWQYIDLLL